MGLQKDNEKQRQILIEQVIPVVGIGASAGGLDALKKLLVDFPENTRLALVIIQHFSSGQESMLSDILSRSTKIPIQKVENGMKIQSNNIYVIPSGKIMTIENGILKLQPKGKSLKPIDEFLISLAADKKAYAIGVILSGTGSDGTEGLQKIKMEGGITFAQDPSTAQYPDMPKNAINAETVNFILPPEKMAQELVAIACHPELIHHKIEAGESNNEDDSEIQNIFFLLKSAFGVNFSNYKRSTTNRRITRRMVLNKIENTNNYIKILRSNKNELHALFDDLLIGVTSFFREPETFTYLKEKVFQNIIEKKQPGQQIKVWIPGCSTGEEVYSVAIAIEEFLEEKNIVDKEIQIFGTDVNQKNVEKARKGVYPKKIDENVSQVRLNQFFTFTNGSYQVTKQIRDMCVFAKHDLIKDPPFSKLNLIVCRNVLIYFDAQLQEKIIPMFHYALKSSGFLILGESESIGKYTYLFETQTKRGVLFRKKLSNSISELRIEPAVLSSIERPGKTLAKLDALTLLRKEADHLLMEEFFPPSLVLNSNLDVLVLRGRVTPYISFDSGDASLNVAKIIRKELRPALQTAIFRAKKSGKGSKETVRIEQGKQTRIIKIQAKLFHTSGNEDSFFLVIFEETENNTSSLKKEGTAIKNVEAKSAWEQQIKDLSEDLNSTKETLQTVVEQQETTNEELGSSMEELQSTNEELMSTNEELETAKEELQSTNEELTTLNDELKNRNQNLVQLNDDLANLMGTIDTAVVIVDNDLKIRRFNSSAETLLRLTPSDLNKSIIDIPLGIPIENLQKSLSKVANLDVVREEIQTSKGRWYQMRIKPYLTYEKKAGGMVISFADITEIKVLEDKLRVVSSMTRHDVRNKLIVITGNTYLLKRQFTRSPDVLKQLERMEQACESIVKIFDFAKIYEQLGVEKLSYVDVGKAVSEAEALFPELSLKIINDCHSLKLLADSFLRQIFYNFLDNTRKYGKNATTARVHCEKADSGELQIIYEDNGVGISAENKPKLFSQGFSTGGSTGNGLFLIKKMIDVYGWKIQEIGEHGKGAKFVISVPPIGKEKEIAM